MSDPLRAFLESVAAGDDARAEEAALALAGLAADALPVLRELLADPHPDRRWWAVRGLAALGAWAPLVHALTDLSPDVRACAAQGLGELRAAEAVDALVDSLADSSPLVARIAADGLARIGSPAVAALIRALRSGETPVRAGAARALSLIAPQEAIPALCAALDDPSAIVAHYAGEALERMGVGLIFFYPP